MSVVSSEYDAPDPFLGVERSLSGRQWRLQEENARTALAIAQKHELPEPLARILAARGIALDAVEGHLNPTLRADLPDPASLKDMDAAAARVADAIEAGESIAIFGDYDVDGATSSSLLRRFLIGVGRDARIYIPDRIAEGYGPSGAAMRQLAGEGASLVITVDCGANAHEALAEGRKAGLDIVVVDHHKMDGDLPPAVAVVNPNRADDLSGCGQAAAVGVAFLLVVAVNRELRARGWYSASRPEPDLMQWLDLVALGTVCDVVPLTGMNRALVLRGLKVMEWGGNAGLNALRDAAGLLQAPDAGHLGFALGPRVNAGGRVGENGQAGLGARLLCTADEEKAAAIAAQLNELNRARREEESAVLAQAFEEAERLLAADPEAPLLLTAGEGWHAGVIGIVASRLKDRYGRPSIVCGVDGAEAKGSGRSVPHVDLGAAVLKARAAGLLIAGGGHAQAAGLTVAADRIGALRDFLGEALAEEVARARTLNAVLRLDGVLGLPAATRDFHDLMERAGPFGAGNPEPRFAFPDMRVVDASVVGTDHVRCVLGDGGRGRLKGIFFRAAESEAGQAILRAAGRTLHVAGRLKPDDWRGRRSVQVEIDDVAWPAAR
ncbi:MAG: single-stranded-DNA-specific exonuclease RecJ [Alphaproteobacteria bacterium]